MFYHASKQEFYQYYSATAVVVDSDSKQERDENEVLISVNYPPCRTSCLTPGLGCVR